MTESKRRLKVFLCHAHSDKDKVRNLYSRLRREGVDAWLDKENLLPGSDWESEIRKAVRESDVVVVCLSKDFNQAGFRQKEVRIALEEADKQPEGEIFIIPARLEECENLESLRKWHWVDLFEDNGYQRLIRALRSRADRIGATLRIRKAGKSIISSQIQEELESEEQTRILADEEEKQRISREKAERELAEKIAREKEELEKARLTVDEEEKKRIVKEKAEREDAKKIERERIKKEIPEKTKLEFVDKKIRGESFENNTPIAKPISPEEKLIKSIKPKIEKQENKKTNISRKPGVITTLSIIGLVGIVCIISLGWVIAENFPIATATALYQDPTNTDQPSSTVTLLDTPTSFSTEIPDFLNGSEILFATKDRSIYSFENNKHSKIGSIASDASDWEWQLDYIWSWSADRDFFILGSPFQDVYFIDRTGKIISELTVPYMHYCPNLSSDGEKIVTYSQAATTGNTYVFNTDGSNFIRLVPSTSMRFGCPSWSPDGKTIAVSASGSGEDNIVILDLAGNFVKEFNKDKYFSDISYFSDPFKWSPDGRELIICGDGGIYKINIETSESLKLFDSSVIICDWSPDGNYVVYVTTTGLNVLDMNTYKFSNFIEMENIVAVAWE